MYDIPLDCSKTKTNVTGSYPGEGEYEQKLQEEVNVTFIIHHCYSDHMDNRYVFVCVCVCVCASVTRTA